MMNRIAFVALAAFAAFLAFSRTAEAKTGPFRKMFSPVKQFPTTENKTGEILDPVETKKPRPRPRNHHISALNLWVRNNLSKLDMIERANYLTIGILGELGN